MNQYTSMRNFRASTAGHKLEYSFMLIIYLNVVLGDMPLDIV